MPGDVSCGPVQYVGDIYYTPITDVTIRITNEVEALSPEAVPYPEQRQEQRV